MIIILISIFLLAVIFHEVAHGWMAYQLGDPTAKQAGRLTLNPIAHIDPIGTIFFPMILVLSGSPFIFGWAKPVPVNFFLLRRPRQGMLWVSAAGITANLLLAIAFSILLQLGLFPYNSYGWVFLSYGVVINLVLAIFNAIPIPPLDGSKILLSVLPAKAARSFARMERYGFIILLALLWFGFLGRVIWPVVSILAGLLGVKAL